jgi:Pyridine nucleotide-disulphide oxidoreductase, dimerisation domain
LRLPLTELPSYAPVGIHTLPEIASIGLDEEQAKSRYQTPLIGGAKFGEIMRGQISGAVDGLLKIVADPDRQHVLAIQIVGESAIELVHVGLMGVQHGVRVDEFLDCAFNFPTFAEAYRIAAGARYRKRYHASQTPYQRIMECPHIADATKERLARLHQTLNPFDLKQRIEAKLRVIFSLVTVTSNVRHRI